MSINEKSPGMPAASPQDEAATMAKVEKVLAAFTGAKSDLIPILQQVQQTLGYLPSAAMRRVADFVRAPECSVFGVATFYAQFKFVPVGRNVIRACRGTACYIKGSPRILEELEKVLGIKDGGTTPDMEYSLETVACIGACALAPTMTINTETYGKMTPKKVAEVLNDRNKAQ